jgi:L,D-transpeptidase ErfK/SrfK
MKNYLNLNTLKILKGKLLPLVVLLTCFTTGDLLLFPSLQASASEPSKGEQPAKVESPNSNTTTPETKSPATTDSTNTPDEATRATEPTADEIHLVVRLKARRVFVYQGDKVLKSFPVAIGKAGWETPKGSFKVFSMEIDPIFKSFKTGEYIYPGPTNPLGPRWIGIWTDGKTQLGFHGTNQPKLIGRAVSHGCIRMKNEDVMKLYEKVKIGTLVKVEP